ncbi:MAG TPA: PQQ-dependent sugar dehydrogenase [Acidimicrobiia bacterium]|jgi:glucose/arabinose dehydrogenase
MVRLKPVILVPVAVAVIALVVFGTVALGGGGEGGAPYVETKPDPMAGVPGTERPGFIKANAGCEDHPRRSFSDGDFLFTTETVLEGLDAPTTLEFFDSDTAFVGQRGGTVLLWDLTAGTATPVIDLTAMTGTEQDQGLLGLAVTPDRRYLLVHFTTEDESKIIAQPLEDGVPTVTGRVDVLTVEQPSSQHNGGTITFDSDGYLWASFGDGGGQGDKYQNAQDPFTPLGSILRLELGSDLEVSGAPGNPYLDGAEGHPWVFAIGIRNPFRFSIDESTGELWIADVGQACVEEVSVLDPSTDAGANLGWSVFEGTRPFLGELQAPHHEPVLSFWRDGGFCAIVGGEVIRGSDLPGLEGMYVFSDYCRSEILVFDRAAEAAFTTGVDVESPLDISSSPSGAVYVASMTGQILELIPTP